MSDHRWNTLPALVDLDNVLCNSQAKVEEIVRSRFVGVAAPETMWDRSQWDWGKMFGLNFKQERKLNSCFHQDESLLAMNAFEGAATSIAKLHDIVPVFIVTSRLSTARTATENWLAINNIRHDRLLFCSEKHLLAKVSSVLFDDNGETAVNFDQNGGVSYLIRKDWNLFVNDEVLQVNADINEAIDHFVRAFWAN